MNHLLRSVSVSLCSKVVIERARLALLPWGRRQELSDLAAQHSQGFDVILGAEVIYSVGFVDALMCTISALLSPSDKVGLVHGQMHAQAPD